MTSPADDKENLDQDDLAAEWESMVGEAMRKGKARKRRRLKLSVGVNQPEF